MSHSDALRHYHNKGEQDYPSYDPPSQSFIVELFGPGLTDAEFECIEAYKQGYEHAKEMAGD